MAAKPNVLIFGGLQSVSRSIASYLVPPEGESLVANLRIVDKYSVQPPTTYLGAEFPKVLAKPNVEYHQANLAVPATVAKMYDPQEGQAPYDYVFDCTGDISPDRPEAIYINHVFNISRLLGLEAAKRGVKAYVRMQQPFYECSEKGSHDEKESVKPAGVVGIWWHETIRALGAIDRLNLVVCRIGLGYGPYVDYSVMAVVLTVASVYGYMKKPMKSLWSPGKNPMHTIHMQDLAGAAWACAEWIAPLGRAEADKIAGEEIPFLNEKSKVSEVEGMIPHTQKIIVPLFNVADDNDTTLDKAGKTMTSLFGTTFEYHNFVTNTMAKFRLDDVVEDINETHVGTWAEMIQKSNPPCPNTHLTTYMSTFALSKHSIAYSNEKLKKIVGYKLKRPEMTHENLTEVIDKWKAEGSWPILDSN